MIRDVLLAVYAIGWLVTVIITAWRTGSVPPELWAVLGVGVGALLAAFKVDAPGRRRSSGSTDDNTEDDR